jgi:hypothetical protein
MATKRNKKYGFSYGNNGHYLMARAKRDYPDVVERAKAGEFETFEAVWKAAGIHRDPHPDDVHLERLFKAWTAADLESRQLFLALIEDEAEAAIRGEYLNHFKPKRGPGPWRPAEGAAIPEVFD